MITVADVREDMLDRAATDHLVLNDLAFTDEDIEWGMKGCARKFNSLPPDVACAVWDKLPDDTSVFFDGVAWALIRRWKRNIAMNDMDYSAGGVTANVNGKLMQNLDALEKQLESQFVDGATAIKIRINLRHAYGQIG